MNRLILNLLSEDQLAEEASLHDPSRVALSIAGALLVLIGLIGVMVSWKSDNIKTRASRLKSQRDELLQRPSDNAPADLRVWKKVADDVLTMNQTRALFAPQLALFKELIPNTVKLNRINIAVSSEAAPVQITVRLDGRVETSRPEIVVQQLIDAIKEHPQLKDGIESVELRSIIRDTASSTGVEDMKLPVALFVIECRYRVKK